MFSLRTKLIVQNAMAIRQDDHEDTDQIISPYTEKSVSVGVEEIFSSDNVSPTTIESQVTLTELVPVEIFEDELVREDPFVLAESLATTGQGTPEPSCSYVTADVDEPFDDTDKDQDYVTESEEISTDEEGAFKEKKKRLHMTHKNTKNPIFKPKVHKTAENDSNISNIENKPPSKNRGRKIIKGETRTVRNNRKKLRNLGLEYVTRKGKRINAKEFRELQACRMKCKDRIDALKREEIFKEFWNVENFDRRVAYIAGMISSREKNITRKKIEGKVHKNRELTHQYFLHVNGENKQICKKCFLTTFDITNRFVTDVIKNKNTSICGITHSDLRGKSEPYNKTPEDALNLVKAHISLIPTYESHYSRKDSNRKYLPTHYTLKRMYDEYKIWLPESTKPVSQKIYEIQFRSTGIKIKKPNKDTCATCDKYNMLIKNDVEKKEEKQKELLAHQSEADKAYEEKKRDKQEAANDISRLVYTFDLQQCLPTPDIKTSVAFYKRQLWTFNFTMRRCKDKKCYCYMWHEGVAGRGANQIASCLYDHFTSNSIDDIKEITLYSDTCSGQNKNSHVLIMFFMAMKKNPQITYINHKFLVPGHTHMECDSDHSVIEKKKKKYPFPIDHPRDWIQLVRTCGQSQPFAVKEMKRENFYEFSSLLKQCFSQKKTDENGQKIVWKNIKWLRYSQEIGVVEYKLSLDKSEPFKKINFVRKKLSEIITLPLSYKSSVPISEEKKKNLLELLPYIDENFHDFYRNLTTKNGIIDTIDGNDSESEQSV